MCNIVGGQQVCWCLLGFSGSFCELQGKYSSRGAFERCDEHWIRSLHSLCQRTLYFRYMFRKDNWHQPLRLLPMHTRLHGSDMQSMYVSRTIATVRKQQSPWILVQATSSARLSVSSLTQPSAMSADTSIVLKHLVVSRSISALLASSLSALMSFQLLLLLFAPMDNDSTASPTNAMLTTTAHRSSSISPPERTSVISL